MRLAMQYCLMWRAGPACRGATVPNWFHGHCHPRIRCLSSAQCVLGCRHCSARRRLRVPCPHRCVHPWDSPYPGSWSSVGARLPAALAIDPRSDNRRNPRRRAILLDRPRAPGQDRRCVAVFIAAGDPASRRELLRKVWLGRYRPCTFSAWRTRNRSCRSRHERHETAALLRSKCRLRHRLGACAPGAGGARRLWHSVRNPIEPSGRNHDRCWRCIAWDDDLVVDPPPRRARRPICGVVSAQQKATTSVRAHRRGLHGCIRTAQAVSAPCLRRPW